MDNQRLFDLVRHQRGELFTAELITKDEYAELAMAHSAVARLEDYDAARAEAAMLREALEAILALTENQPIEEAGYLDNWVFKPSRGSAVDSAIQGLRTALSGSSGEWLEQNYVKREQLEVLESSVISVASESGIYDGDDPESAVDAMRVELNGYSKFMWDIQRICRADSAKPDDVFAAIQTALARVEKAEAELSDETKRREALERRVNELIPLVQKAEAERDGLAAKLDGIKAKHKQYDEALLFAGPNPLQNIARITAEARRKALLEAAGIFDGWDDDSRAERLRQLAEEADHA